MNVPPELSLYFIAVGPQRTGSTWLHEILKSHPSIDLPIKIKETMFFDRHYHKGNSWLLSHFESTDRDQYMGEVAPSYFGSKDALDRIKAECPDCKIIINIRNPIDNAYSMYLHEYSKGRVQGEISHVIKNKPETLRTGTYDEWIPLWQSAFGKNNVCLVWMDEIKKNPKTVHENICKFLNLQTNHFPETLGNKQINTAKVARFPQLTKIGMRIYHLFQKYRMHTVISFCKRIHLDKITFGVGKNPEISPADYQALAELYSTEIEFLERLSGRNLSSWRTPDWNSPDSKN